MTYEIEKNVPVAMGAPEAGSAPPYQRVLAARQRQVALDEQRRQDRFAQRLLWPLFGVVACTVAAWLLMAGVAQ